MNLSLRRSIAIAPALLIAATLACNAGGAPNNPQGTVQAVYATITAQAGMTPFPTTLPPTNGTLPPTPTQFVPPTPSPTPPDSRGAITTVGWCTAPMATDGDDADWKTIPGVTTLALNQATYGGGAWSGAADLSGAATLCWTQSSLFMFVRVTDDVHAQTQRGVDSWKGDEVELMFDSDLRGDFFKDVWNEDDSQFSFNPGNFADLVPQPFRYRPTAGQPRGINMIAKSTGTNDDYVIEAEIAWEELLTRPTAGINYGLCVALNDNDNPAKAQEDTLVSHCASLHVSDPTTWQTVTFAPAP